MGCRTPSQCPSIVTNKTINETINNSTTSTVNDYKMVQNLATAVPCLNVDGTQNNKLFALGTVSGCTNVNKTVNNGEMTIGTVALILI